jgi:glycosyltransferase involved in cell wall biosynthesis
MRLFVCDPVCVQAFGHNVPALRYFSNAFRDQFDTIIALCSRKLPEAVSTANGFTPFFDFYYHGYISVPDEAPKSDQVFEGGFVDREEAMATADATRLLSEFDIVSTDAILFPSLDFYGVAGLLNALRNHPPSKRPRLLLRFIGVMENGSTNYRDPSAELVGRLREAIKWGLDVKASAETPRLADHLAEKLTMPVWVTPYPEVGSRQPLPRHGPFTVFCPGSAREDKGFYRLLEVFRAVRNADPELEIRFVTQVPPHRDAIHRPSYISHLGALPGVTLLEPSISAAEMMDFYQASSAVFLPYDVDIYRLRGSAVMMEAAFLGRPAITLDGTAFAEQIRYYGLGTVVPSLGDAAAAVLDLAAVPADVRSIRSDQARRRFMVDMENAYERWMAA